MFETSWQYKKIKKYAEKEQYLPFFIKTVNNRISEYLNIELVCFDYIHFISKRHNEACVHTNRLELFPYYSQDPILLTAERICDIKKIIDEKFSGVLYDWNKVNIKNGYYCYSILERNYMCIPKISTQNLKVSFSSYEYLFWNTVVSQSIEVIDKQCINQFGASLVSAQYKNHTIHIFIKDAEYDKINDTTMENIKIIFRDNLKKIVNTSFFDVDDVLISIIKSSRMIDYR